jgi:hypothetical protein
MNVTVDLSRAILFAAALAAAAGLAQAGESQERAQQDFMALCAPCHGTDAHGDGPAAKALKTRPADLTRIVARYGTFPRDRIAAAILGLDMPDSHGSREMPIWGNRLVDEALKDDTSVNAAKGAAADVEARIEGLVAYLNSIQSGD